MKNSVDFEFSRSRNFEYYAQAMDASLYIKWRQISPWIMPRRPGKGGVIVDEGCGTGKLLSLLGRKFPKARVIGREISSHLLKQSTQAVRGIENISIVRGDATKAYFSPASVTTKIFSSIWHELYSYYNYREDVLDRVLRISRRELAPGGRIIIRDGIKPNPGNVVMRLTDRDGRAKGKTHDPRLLSTHGMFLRFVEDFTKPYTISYRVLRLGHRSYFVVRAEDAYEFLMRKDYRENWEAETHEIFGVWTSQEYRAHLEAAGFRIVHLKPSRNRWIVKHRLEKKVKLYRLNKNNALIPIPFPHTHILAVGEKSR